MNDDKVKGDSDMAKITIDRSKPFDPSFILQDHNYASGYARILDGDTESRSTTLVELDLDNVQLVSLLKGDEKSIGGVERFKRIDDSKYIRLDAGVFLTLWNNQHLIPENWKSDDISVHFDGTVIEHSFDKRFLRHRVDNNWNVGTLSLWWSEKNGWLWSLSSLNLSFCRRCLSAVLEG